MAFCSNCGNELKDGAQFCPNCGQQVNQRPSTSEQPKGFVESLKETWKELESEEKKKDTKKKTTPQKKKDEDDWKYGCGLLVVIALVIGFFVNECSGDDSKDETNAPQTEQVVSDKQTETKESETEVKEEQVPQKSKEDEIRELGYRDGVIWGKEDNGQYLVEYIQMGLPMSSALERVKLVARKGYKENYGSDISDELLEEFAEQFMEGYKSVVVKE